MNRRGFLTACVAIVLSGRTVTPTMFYQHRGYRRYRRDGLKLTRAEDLIINGDPTAPKPKGVIYAHA